MAADGKVQGGLAAVAVAVVVALVAAQDPPFWLRALWPDLWTETLPPSSEMGVLEFNTNRQANDLNSGDEVRRADDCADLCARDERCRAMTFVAHPTGGGGKCWLKNDAGSPVRFPGMTSAVKLHIPKS